MRAPSVDPPGRDWSSVSPNEFLCPASKFAPAWDPLTMGTGVCQKPASAQASQKVTDSFGYPPGSLLPRISVGCRSTAATPLSSQELQANPCSGGGAFLPPPSAQTWVSGVFLLYVAPLVAIAVVQIFLLLCNSVSPNSLPSSQMGLDRASGVSVFDPPGTGEASDSFSQKNYSCSPPLQKPCHTNPVQQQRNDIFNTGITGYCHDSCVDPDSMPPMMRLLNWTPKEKWKECCPIQLPMSKINNVFKIQNCKPRNPDFRGICHVWLFAVRTNKGRMLTVRAGNQASAVPLM